MKLDGTYTFTGPRETVWELLQDPAVLARALPGTERLTLVSEDHYEGLMKVSVGPLTAAAFSVTVVLGDKAPPERFTIRIDGTGGVGYTRGTASVVLEALPDATTSMRYSADVQIGGRIAAVGQRLLDSVARMMMRQALEALSRELQTRLHGNGNAGRP